MKKSEIYKAAQIAVIDCLTYSADVRLEIIKELQEAQGIAEFCEKQEEKNDGTV